MASLEERARDAGASRYMSLAESATELGIPLSTAYKHARRGTYPVPTWRYSGRLRVLKDDQAAFITSHTEAAS